MALCINPNCEKAQKQEDQGLSLFCTGCGSSLLINDLYRVKRYLGGGGFGTTYLVDDCGISKVLKVLHNTDPKAIALFDQEARVLQGLAHPGIPTVEIGGRFDYFPRGSQEPLRCLVMEYIEGETLESYLAKNNYRPISEKAAILWLQQLMEILVQVHSANFFHRDIKPANIMLRNSEPTAIALIDFGTAREETQTYLQKQQGKQVTGIVSPGYTPYEQEHGQAEYRSDFFAVGRTFVFLLTGKTPDQFTVSLKKGLVWQQEAQGYRQELRDLIDDLMRPDVSDRPINAQAVLEKLKPLSKFYKTQATVNIAQTPQLSTNALTTPAPTSFLLTRRNVLIGLAAVGTTGLVVISGKKPGILSANVRSFTEKLPGGVPLEMIGIPAGKFMMGSPNSDPDAKPNEKPAHLVTLQSFAIGKYPVTQAQWIAVMKKNPSYFQNRPNNPVEKISWDEAQEFCQKLSNLTGKVYRLPSEAQWEYACRAGTTTRFYWGDDATKIRNYAWFEENSDNETHSVGQKNPNNWGLYDMSGNVGEWCSDSWYENYKGAPKDGQKRNYYFFFDRYLKVFRGGAWSSSAENCRSASRKDGRNLIANNVGLRVVYSVE